MSHRIILTTSTLALAASTALATASTASADDRYAGPNGAISASCAGAQVASGGLRDSAGTAHPTARWRLYSSKADGGTYCLKVWDGKAGSHAMNAMVRPTDNFHDGAKHAGTVSSATAAVSVTHAAGDCIGFTAELTDGGTLYAHNEDEARC